MVMMKALEFLSKAEKMAKQVIFLLIEELLLLETENLIKLKNCLIKQKLLNITKQF